RVGRETRALRVAKMWETYKRRLREKLSSIQNRTRGIALFCTLELTRQRPKIIEAAARLTITGARIDIGSLLLRIPDHRGCCATRYDGITGAIQRCRLIPGVLLWIIGPQAPIWPVLGGIVPAPHHEQYVVFAIPGTHALLTREWIARTLWRNR